MSASKATLLGLAALAYAAPQGVTQDIKPEGSAPEGCQSSYDGTFGISVVKPAAKRDFVRRQDDSGELLLTLENGVLKDGKGRTGYIASNNQFQFDAPPQVGAIYTGGWSVCPDGNLALGPSEDFFQCLSGGFYNLYDKNTAEQCAPVIVKVLPSSGGSSGAASQSPDGQPVAPTTTVSQIGDGQIQVPTSVPAPPPPAVSQIGDGQIQAPSAPVEAPVTQIGDGQIQAPSAPVEAPVTQIGDGQIQAPSAPVESPGAPVTQIGDGQIQAPSAPVETPEAPVTQIGDGQIQAPSAPVETPEAPVTQIGDGQIQAPSAPVESPEAPVTQIGDGQIQAPSAPVESPGAPVTQIGDGQIQAPSAPVETPGATVTQIGDGQIQAPSAPVAVPGPNTSTPVVSPSSGDRIFPATMAALFVAVIGTFMVL